MPHAWPYGASVPWYHHDDYVTQNWPIRTELTSEHRAWLFVTNWSVIWRPGNSGFDRRQTPFPAATPVWQKCCQNTCNTAANHRNNPKFQSGALLLLACVIICYCETCGPENHCNKIHNSFLFSVTRHTVKLWKSFDAINEALFLLKGKRKVSARRSKLCNCPEICVILSHLLSNDLKTEKSSNLCWLLKHKHKELPMMTSKHGRMASDTVRATHVVGRSPRWYLILIHRFRWYAFKKGVV